MPARSARHTALVNACRLELSRLGIMCWGHATGGLVDITGRLMRFGLPGSADIIGIIPPSGRVLFVECKTGRGKLSEQQEKFRLAVVAHGAVHILARSVDQLTAAVVPHLHINR